MDWDLWFNKNSPRNKFSLIWGWNYNALQPVARVRSDFTCLWAHFGNRLGAGGAAPACLAWSRLMGAAQGAWHCGWQRHHNPAEPFPLAFLPWAVLWRGVTWMDQQFSQLWPVQNMWGCLLACLISFVLSGGIIVQSVLPMMNLCNFCMWLVHPLAFRGSCHCFSAAWMKLGRCFLSQTVTINTQM